MLKSSRRSIQAIRKLFDLVYGSSAVTPTPVDADRLLLETGDYILQETSDYILLDTDFMLMEMGDELLNEDGNNYVLDN